jgi:hypothetical protein
MTTINLWYAAGLGDIAMSYASLAWETAQIIPWRRAKLSQKFRAVLCTVNDRVPDLFRHNPYFEEVTYHTWRADWWTVKAEQAAGHPYLEEIGFHRPPERMPFFLSDEEKAVFQEIAARPYVGLHFFAGMGERNWFGRIHHEGVERIIQTVLDHGFQVVLLGGSSIRQEGDYRATMHERFACTRPGVFNLLDRHSVSLHCQLAATATALVGTMSCYVSLGTQFQRPAFVVLPPSLQSWFSREDGGVFKTLADQGAWLNWWDNNDTLERELSNLQRFLEAARRNGPVTLPAKT